ncbi:hypothetical protein [Roseateles violae]|uniref:Uncharacterized protein n=1 Tax=Roseateles violae TaxID=3058042 RepID=A0ABT8DPZ0_9BURK|nr:hypothetical protein [Pelomonas sp. PFR6]MDN3920406.1 hypothetical protein [Pelomonas sp. PFR6]MDN3920409.1 hypothetical protein [Pelomonas sp. PFR6]
MAPARISAIALVAVLVPSIAVAGASNCWVKKVALEGDAIHVTFEAPSALAYSGTAVLINATQEAPFAATYALGRNQQLQVKRLPTSPERCELEPVIGAAFNGVARNVWLLQPGTSDLIVMATIVKAETK